MRGSLIDFYTLEPVAPVVARILPPDFDPAAIDRYLDAPLAPEVLECERCDPRACHALLKQGRALKPDCAAWLVMDAPVNLPVSLDAQVLATLAEHGPQTLQDLAARLGVSYWTLRHHVDGLTTAGCIVGAGLRANGGGRAKLYAALPGATPPPPPPPLSRPSHARARAMSANETRIVALLKARGALAVSDLATATGLHNTVVLDRLRALEAAGAVRQTGTETRVAAGFHNRRYKVQLWAATEDDHE